MDTGFSFVKYTIHTIRCEWDTEKCIYIIIKRNENQGIQRSYCVILMKMVFAQKEPKNREPTQKERWMKKIW